MAGPAAARGALGRGLIALVRCARFSDEADADDLLAYLRAPGKLRVPALADRLEAELRAEGETSLARARELWAKQNPDFELSEIE